VAPGPASALIQSSMNASAEGGAAAQKIGGGIGPKPAGSSP
jgi:membrane fusion protein, multidrug efflux system